MANPEERKHEIGSSYTTEVILPMNPLIPEKKVKKLCDSCYNFIHANVGKCNEQYGVKHVTTQIVNGIEEQCECSCGHYKMERKLTHIAKGDF